MSTGAERIAAERARQVSEEGYTPEHDSGHAEQLTRAAEAYAYYAEVQILTGDARPWNPPLIAPTSWPWDERYWKPSDDPRRNLEKAGALIAAAIDSLSYWDDFPEYEGVRKDEEK